MIDTLAQLVPYVAPVVMLAAGVLLFVSVWHIVGSTGQPPQPRRRGRRP